MSIALGSNGKSHSSQNGEKYEENIQFFQKDLKEAKLQKKRKYFSEALQGCLPVCWSSHLRNTLLQASPTKEMTEGFNMFNYLLEIL